MKKRILIVEDEAVTALALKMMVERLSYEVIATADTGEDAIRHAYTQNPDLVLMDTRLQSPMSGVEAANIIWEKLGIRSIFISAYNARELEADYRGQEPFLLLVKPAREQDIGEMLGRLLSN